MLTTAPWLNFLVKGNFNVVTAEEGFKSFFFFSEDPGHLKKEQRSSLEVS